MAADPYDAASAAFADVGERLEEYAAVWRTAIERNAANDYAAADFMEDLQTLWGMSIRDAARVGSAVLEGVAPLIPDSAFGPQGNTGDPHHKS